MKISKTDAQKWFELFAQIQDSGEDLGIHQMEIVYSTMSQIEERVERDHEELKAQIPHLRSLNGRTLYVGPDELFPRGCRGCLTGTGLTAIRKTNRCNIQCPFCYNYGELDCQEPIGEGLWEIGGGKYRVEDMDLLFSIQRKPGSICYVYLEPFMEIEKYYPMIRKFHDAGIHQHMYTNGTLANEKNLKELAEAGLDELRFNLGATNCSDKVIENIRRAAKCIPYVGIETPMTPDFYAQFHQKKEAILSTGLQFMNCAELHLNENNIGNYEGENFYMSRLGYFSPVWSRNLTLTLMAEADRESWPIVVHDCSNRTKFARDLHLRAMENGWFGSTTYGREFDQIPCYAFLPILYDPDFTFLEEEELPKGFRFEDIVL
ncbi:MAG: radical SAM protein [Clostridia bacterium]|nr:radical SAM protein [Clostridia bacterium]